MHIFIFALHSYANILVHTTHALASYNFIENQSLIDSVVAFVMGSFVVLIEAVTL